MEKSNTNIILGAIVMVVLLAVAIYFVVMPAKVSAPDEVESVGEITLSASIDKTAYAAGEEMLISLNLLNSGSEDVCISDGATGNIRFTSFTRDGEPVETRSATSYFLTSFSEILKSDLVSISPGNSIDLELKSSEDPGLGAQAFQTTIPEGASGLATFYNVGTSGQYAIELIYEYIGGASSDCDTVFSNPTNPVHVTFEVS